MIIEQIWTGNSARNFFYIVACSETGDAIAIDPIDPPKALESAKARGWNIARVLNTHEHADHIGGNDAVIAATGARLLAPYNAGNRIPRVDEGLREGDVLEVGTTGTLEVIETPGHTPIHISLFGESDGPHLLCGDTLFNAGVGHCRSGDPHVLYGTFRDKIAKLPDATRIYPGHDYIANNLRFTLDREPDNKDAQALLAAVEDQDPDHALVTTLGQERQVNTFLRLDSAAVIDGLKDALADFPARPGEADVFLGLRRLRDSW